MRHGLDLHLHSTKGAAGICSLSRMTRGVLLKGLYRCRSPEKPRDQSANIETVNSKPKPQNPKPFSLTYSLTNAQPESACSVSASSSAKTLAPNPSKRTTLNRKPNLNAQRQETMNVNPKARNLAQPQAPNPIPPKISPIGNNDSVTNIGH